MNKCMTMLALAFVGLVRCGELVATEAAQVHEREDASGDAPDQNAWLKPQGPRQMHPHIPATSNVGEGSLVDHMVLCGKKAVAGVHDDLTDCRSGVVNQLDLVTIAHVPSRARELLIDEDSRLLFGLSVGRHSLRILRTSVSQLPETPIQEPCP